MREAVIPDMKAKRIKAWDGNCLITVSLDESVISVMIRWNNLADRFMRVRNQPDAEKTRRRKQSTRDETSNTSAAWLCKRVPEEATPMLSALYGTLDSGKTRRINRRRRFYVTWRVVRAPSIATCDREGR